ncbi:unnamed protein product, partial [Closterium sp. Naga37s-1]
LPLVIMLSENLLQQLQELSSQASARDPSHGITQGVQNHTIVPPAAPPPTPIGQNQPGMQNVASSLRAESECGATSSGTIARTRCTWSDELTTDFLRIVLDAQPGGVVAYDGVVQGWPQITQAWVASHPRQPLTDHQLRVHLKGIREWVRDIQYLKGRCRTGVHWVPQREFFNPPAHILRSLRRAVRWEYLKRWCSHTAPWFELAKNLEPQNGERGRLASDGMEADTEDTSGPDGADPDRPAATPSSTHSPNVGARSNGTRSPERQAPESMNAATDQHAAPEANGSAPAGQPTNGRAFSGQGGLDGSGNLPNAQGRSMGSPGSASGGKRRRGNSDNIARCLDILTENVVKPIPILIQ